MQVSTSFKLVLRKNTQLQYNGTNRLLLSFATVLQPPNIFRFSSQLCLNGQQLLRSERSVFLYIYIEAPLHSPYNSFSLFSNKHCLFHIFYDHASNTCHMCTPYVHASYHMPYCKVPLCELQLVMLIYCIRMHIILLCEQCRY